MTRAWYFLIALLATDIVAAASSACPSRSRPLSTRSKKSYVSVTSSTSKSARTATTSLSRPSCSTAAPQSGSKVSASRSRRSSCRSAGCTSSSQSATQLSSSSSSPSSATSFSSFTNSALSVLNIDGCSPITVSISTVSQVSTISVHTETVTSYLPLQSDTTVTVTVTTALTLVTYPNVYSQLVGTVSKTVITVVPPIATITQPIPLGFTPVGCNPIFYGPVIVSTNYSTSTDTAPSTELIFTSDPAALFVFVSTVTEYTATTTSTVTDTFGIPYNVIVTSTSTRDSPTSTIYDACATINVVEVRGAARPVLNTTDYEYNSAGVNIAALDATDCCAQCQANSSCVGSGYAAIDLTAGVAPCTLFIKAPIRPQSCDPQYIGAQVIDFTPFSSVNVSNSGCGQILV